MTAFIAHFNLGESGVGNCNESITNFAADFYLPSLVGKSEISAWKRYYPLKHIVRSTASPSQSQHCVYI